MYFLFCVWVVHPFVYPSVHPRAPFQKGLRLIASFTRFAIELRLISIVRLIATLCKMGPWSCSCEQIVLTPGPGVLWRWRCHGILDWTLDSGSKGCGFDSPQCLVLFVHQQDTLSTLLLSTQVYKWVPGRMQTLSVAWCGMCVPLKWHLARILPRELRRCTMSVGLILNPVTGVMIHCKALWVVSPN